jgi:hypothetical protein
MAQPGRFVETKAAKMIKKSLSKTLKVIRDQQELIGSARLLHCHQFAIEDLLHLKNTHPLAINVAILMSEYFEDLSNFFRSHNLIISNFPRMVMSTGIGAFKSDNN